MRFFICILWVICFNINAQEIKTFQDEKNYSFCWNTEKIDDEILTDPRKIESDSEGNVYILDRGDNFIKIFDLQGNFIAKFGGKGKDPGEFIQPVEFFTDSQNRKYIYDLQLGKLNIFSSENQFVKALPLPGLVEKIRKIKNGFIIQSCRFVYKQSVRIKKYTYTIYDENLKNRKDFYSSEFKKAVKRKNALVYIPFASDDFWEILDEDRILIFDSEEFRVLVFDENGIKIKDEKFDGKREKISQTEKEEIFKVFSERIKRIKLKFSDIEFPSRKPFFQQIMKINDHLILLSSEKDNKYLLFDSEGNLKGERKFPDKYINHKSRVFHNRIIVNKFTEDGVSIISAYKLN
ncbi:MAG: 6-bladed beta-propeller [Rhodothermaceae bacterium]